MRIAARLRIISGFAIAALVVLVPVLIWSVVEFKSAKNDYVLADAIRVNFFERASFRDQYFLYREDRTRRQWDKSKETADRLLRQAASQFQGQEDLQTVERLRRNIEDTATIFHRIVGNTEKLDSAAGNRHVYAELDKRLFSQLLLKAAAVRDSATILLEASAQRAEQTYQRLLLIVGLFALTLALAVILTALHTGKLIRKRLAPLHDGAKIIADGNLDHRIRCDGTDEFVELAQSINAMTDKLQAFTRQLEAEIGAHKQAEAKISELNHDFVSFLENTSDFIYFKDRDSRFRFCSQPLAKITGHASWRDMIGKHDLEVFPQDTARIYYEEELPIFREGKPLLNKIDPYYDESGNQGWVSTNKWPLLDQEGNVVGLFGISRDITAHKRMEEALRQMNETLEQRVRDGIARSMEQERLLIQQSRLAAMGEMIGNIAHQWRQPINALTLLLGNIEDAYDYHELDREYLDKEVRTGQELIQKMSSTIDDFRNFFKPNKEKQCFCVSDSVEEAIKLVIHSFKNNNIEIGQEHCATTCTALGYPNEFAQVVLNALSNAKDAIGSKKIAGEVHILVAKTKYTVTVTIRDNGGGIPTEILGKVFDPYFTTKEKGTGIGLYMSKMIMEHMDGEIAIRNTEGGAEVLLSLPLAPETAQ